MQIHRYRPRDLEDEWVVAAYLRIKYDEERPLFIRGTTINNVQKVFLGYEDHLVQATGLYWSSEFKESSTEWVGPFGNPLRELLLGFGATQGTANLLSLQSFDWLYSLGGGHRWIRIGSNGDFRITHELAMRIVGRNKDGQPL